MGQQEGCAIEGRPVRPPREISERAKGEGREGRTGVCLYECLAGKGGRCSAFSASKGLTLGCLTFFLLGAGGAGGGAGAPSRVAKGRGAGAGSSSYSEASDSEEGSSSEASVGPGASSRSLSYTMAS